MRRISNFQWLLILAMCALAVFVVGAASLYLRLNLPNLLPESLNDSLGGWAFWTFWAIHAPLIIILSRRFSFERGRLTKNLLIYFSVGIFWAMLVQGSSLLLLPVLHDSTAY